MRRLVFSFVWTNWQVFYMEIYILRHGTTTWNKEHRIQGSTNIPLDDLGVEMARQTGLTFRKMGIRFDEVYSSPLSRAYETTLLAIGMGAELSPLEIPMIIPDSRLKELSFGNQEGRYIDELLREDVPFVYFKKDTAEYDRRAAMDPSMESLTDLCKRTADFLREVVECRENKPEEPEESDPGATGHLINRISFTENPERILISAHGVCNKGLLMHIRGEEDMGKFWGNGLQPNCGVDVVHFDEESGEYRIISENQIYYPEELLKKAGTFFSK